MRDLAADAGVVATWRAVPVVTVLLVGLAACSGSTTTSSPPTSLATTSAAATASTGSSVGGEQYGSPVTITTADGYQFVVRASRPYSLPTVNFPDGMGDETTPPGKTHVVIDVEVQNPLTDRQEPLGGELTSLTDDSTQFDLAIPKADAASFGLSAAPAACADRSPANLCFFGGWLAVPSGYSAADTDIPAGAMAFLQITEIGGVPQNAPLSHVVLYAYNGSSEVPVPPA